MEAKEKLVLKTSSSYGTAEGKNLEPLIDVANWLVEEPDNTLIASISAIPLQGAETAYKF